MHDDVGNPHDQFFRKLMEEPAAPAIIARQALPPEVLDQLDLSNIAREDDSWVDEELRTHFADALFKVPLRGWRNCRGR